MAEKTNQRVKYRNGKIFTADENHSFVDTMIVENGRIVWTGKEENAEDCGYKETDRTVDLNGECVLPGFVDAHMHPVMLADFSRKISALPPKVHSIEELIQEIRRVRERQKAGQWIEGWGYDEGKLAEKRSVNRYDLDRGCSDSPVSMIRTCGHIRCVNSMALRLAGIDRNTPDPEGGRDRAGRKRRADRSSQRERKEFDPSIHAGREGRRQDRKSCSTRKSSHIPGDRSSLRHGKLR